MIPGMIPGAAEAVSNNNAGLWYYRLMNLCIITTCSKQQCGWEHTWDTNIVCVGRRYIIRLGIALIHCICLLITSHHIVPLTCHILVVLVMFSHAGVPSDEEVAPLMKQPRLH